MVKPESKWLQFPSEKKRGEDIDHLKGETHTSRTAGHASKFTGSPARLVRARVCVCAFVYPYPSYPPF